MVDGFNVSEYDVLSERGIFQALKNDNPYSHNVKEVIFDTEDHRGQYY
jgi:hypothetical protein